MESRLFLEKNLVSMNSVLKRVEFCQLPYLTLLHNLTSRLQCYHYESGMEGRLKLC